MYDKFLVVVIIVMIVIIMVQTKVYSDKLDKLKEQKSKKVMEVSKNYIDTLDEIESNHISTIEQLVKERDKLQLQVNNISEELSNNKLLHKGKFEVTAYDLSVQSCGKNKEHPLYGITASGYNLTGLSREDAMVVAVDPTRIPLGTQVYVEFDEPRLMKYTGIYTARDVGGAIKGNRIDIFMGEDSYDECMWFGRESANVYVVSRNE